MQSIQLKTHVGSDGILQVQMPPDVKDIDLEVMLVFQPLPIEQQKPRVNAWGKPVTQKSIKEAISGMQQLRQEIGLDRHSIRSMIEEGRRF